MSIAESFQIYSHQASSASAFMSSHQDGHIDYMRSTDSAGEHHDKYVDCDHV